MAIKTYRDGRVKLTGADYAKAKKEKWESQGKRCANCGLHLPFEYSEFHHYGGRGMGGGKRNDADPSNRVLCGGPYGCHEKARFEHLREKAVCEQKS